MDKRTLLAAGIIMACVGAFFALQAALPTRAQTEAENLRELIESLSAQGTLMTFVFAEPIAPNVTIRESTGSDLRVGADHVCFSEPWNSGARFRCTPFSNIVSMTYLD